MTSAVRLLILFVTILLVCTAATEAAESRIYRTVDEEGNVVFTDVPPREDQTSEQIVVETANSFLSEEAVGPQQQWLEAEEGEAEESAFNYRSLVIVSPQDDEPVRENAGNLTVVAVASPELRRGHRMRVLVDGRLLQEGGQSDFTLENVDRGTHSLSTEIIDQSGIVLIRSESSSFHMLRFAGGGR